MQNNLIKAPLQRHSCPDFHVIQYADDSVLIMPACLSQLHHLKNLLMHFTAYTGLRVNFDKSMMGPINTNHNKMLAMATVLGCSIGSLPLTYLRLHLCLTKPRLEDFFPSL